MGGKGEYNICEYARTVESRQDAVRTRRKQDYPEETGIIR